MSSDHAEVTIEVLKGERRLATGCTVRREKIENFETPCTAKFGKPRGSLLFLIEGCFGDRPQILPDGERPDQNQESLADRIAQSIGRLAKLQRTPHMSVAPMPRYEGRVVA